jgi:alpha,alpha-trehalose phosphorylase
LVSFVQRAVAAMLYEVEPLDDSTRLVVQSELVANEPMPDPADDPRTGTNAVSPLRSEQASGRDTKVVLVHSTEASGLRLAAGMDHIVEGPDGTETHPAEYGDDLGRVTITADVAPGQRLRVVKFLAYGWSSQRSTAALRDQVAAALAEARRTGWEGLLAGQRAYLDDFWDRADVELDGDAELQQALRFALFHTLQAGARGERRAIAAKGLTGPGYNGHAFWDTETFVLPVLTYTAPDAARDALRWRHATLGLACERAQQLGLAGAAFPWRTIAGQECSSYWPAGTAAFHVNADIAHAAARYAEATGDEQFERTTGCDLLVHTARLWASLGHHDGAGAFRIDGVTGPDEYSALGDNNIYTNLMAARNLRAAAAVAERYPKRARELRVSADEVAAWRAAADGVVIPYDAERGVHSQAEGFTAHQVWDFAQTSPDEYPLLAHFPYFDLYRKQVVKQADLVLAIQLCPDEFTEEEKARNFEYYEALTVRDSSLSACSQAIVAAETGHLDLAYDYLAETALMDLADLEHNTRDGLHIAALAGSWLVLVQGFGGMRYRPGHPPGFAPRLPAALTRLTFTVILRGRHLRVEVMPGSVTYILDGEGPPLEITHHGTPVTVASGQPESRDIPRHAARPRPSQPPGREPARRTRDEPVRHRRGKPAEPARPPEPAQPAGEAAPAGP